MEHRKPDKKKAAQTAQGAQPLWIITAMLAIFLAAAAAIIALG